MFNLSHSKLISLAAAEGYAEVSAFLEDHAFDGTVPAICMAQDCDHTTDLEPDQRRGLCDVSGRRSMQSALVIAGVI
ncbi:MAG: hypothetical protein VX874_07580 [Pseudomonadota bacterium]|nr:hypothetical protein [Pseudomonadota bacterium]